MAVTDAPTLTAVPDWIPADSFANRLVVIRNERDLTQRGAAALCDLDDGSWSNWENGKSPRGMNDVVRKIAEGLGVDRDWLMWGSEPLCPHCGEPRSRCLASSDQGTGGAASEVRRIEADVQNLPTAA